MNRLLAKHFSNEFINKYTATILNNITHIILHTAIEQIINHLKNNGISTKCMLCALDSKLNAHKLSTF